MIKLNVSIAGKDFSHIPGETVNMDKGTERRLVESGQAEYVTSKKKGKK